MVPHPIIPECLKMGTPIKIHWDDPTSVAGWVEDPLLVDVRQVVTLGWYAGHTSRYLWLAGSKGNDESWADVTVLPVGCITSVSVAEETA